MADNHTSNHQALFLDLSEANQEILIAGQGFNVIGKTDFFFQKTDIDSAADSDLNLEGSESSTQSSKYKLSQITLGTSFTFGIPIINYPGNKLSDFLPNFLNKLFY
jgi:hypothetical protein